MKRLLACLIATSIFSTPLFAGAKEFKPADTENITKFANKTLDLKLKKLKKLGVKKLVIMECFGEYVTSREVTNSASSQRYTGRLRTKTDTLEFDKDYYTNTSNLVFEEVKAAFEANGIEIISREDLQANEKYASFNMEEEKSGRGASAGMFKPTVVEKSQKVSASNLGIFPSSPLKMIKLMMNISAITHSVGADGMLQVKFKISKGKKDRPVLTQFDIILNGGMKGTEVGFKGNKKMRYDFMVQNEQLVKLKEDLISGDDVYEGKKGPFSVEKYDKALKDILYAITDGIKESIKTTLAK
jgi:hypothetical protein